MSAELTRDDLERGRTTAMIAALGRVQLTLDLIERRLGRVEDAVLEIGETLAAEREAGLVPAELPYLDAVDDPADEEAADPETDPEAGEPDPEPAAEDEIDDEIEDETEDVTEGDAEESA